MEILKNFIAVSCVILVISLSPITAHSVDSETSTAKSKAEACAVDPACPRSSWKEEFKRLCAQTDIATSYKPEQLRKLISDSDELLVRLENLQDSQAKIYLFRTRGCRDFFVYALELQKSDGDPAPD